MRTEIGVDGKRVRRMNQLEIRDQLVRFVAGWARVDAVVADGVARQASQVRRQLPKVDAACGSAVNVLDSESRLNRADLLLELQLALCCVNRGEAGIAAEDRPARRSRGTARS